MQENLTFSKPLKLHQRKQDTLNSLHYSGSSTISTASLFSKASNPSSTGDCNTRFFLFFCNTQKYVCKKKRKSRESFRKRV